jgi:hypothetical protein
VPLYIAISAVERHERCAGVGDSCVVMHRRDEEISTGVRRRTMSMPAKRDAMGCRNFGVGEVGCVVEDAHHDVAGVQVGVLVVLRTHTLSISISICVLLRPFLTA